MRCWRSWMWLCVLVLTCCFNSNAVNALAWPFGGGNDENESWHGKWFPFSPDKKVDNNEIIEYLGNHHANLSDDMHGIKMGIPESRCDDGKVNITIDWDGSPINYTCYDDKKMYLPDLSIHPILHSDYIPKQYSAPHKCMNEAIEYDDLVPTFGTHRPLWPKCGEYLYLPRQRWLHSLEHGAIVLLYHPCANKQELKHLKSLVRGCLYRHIITPFNMLEPKHPLVLVSWGNRFEMSKVVPKLVVDFIRNTALRGPEQKSEDGQFDAGLVKQAEVVSDKEDKLLCPHF